ncbi:hypothetical protein CKAH01_05816 [Colletotrichum kahawae]|uniref:Ankyrin repeat protein n=1 Tax=Colletotrichum kahawae TaxID=34407 RepID=A0AAE0D565_COLKA|nr:hypothetical protein CKAH01_05816 [Colletotrichum kahawae]
MLPCGLVFEGPLTAAVRSNAIDAVKSLLDGNHCANEDNSLVRNGRRPLQMAVECGYLDLIKLLLDAGADINALAAQSHGATALQLAAIKGYLGVAKMLVDRGADVNAPGATDEGGRTALEGAAEHGRIDTVMYLLSQEVETNDKGRLSYLRAIRYAELEGHMVVAKLFKTWREWTADNDELWDDKHDLSRVDCEWFDKGDWEYQSDSELESESPLSEEAHDGDGIQDLDLDDVPIGAAHMHEISVTASARGGILAELEDLEMMTSDTFAFWSGV